MVSFEKLHGIGNDFIIIDDRANTYDVYNDIARKMCDRRFGIGADGFMVVKNSDVADIQMLFFNADGSQAPMCGNGIRCFSKYVCDHSIIQIDKFSVETLGGIMKPEIFKDEAGEVEFVKVNLGKPMTKAKLIPVETTEEIFINQDIDIDGQKFKISAVQIGSIHAVVFVDNTENFDLDYYGPKIETHKFFPEKINVNFCEIESDEKLKVITWERGVGQTLACGTGAASCAYFANQLHNTMTSVSVELLGGTVNIEFVENEVYMTGPAEFICSGEYRLKR